jgi:hypothetical protein
MEAALRQFQEQRDEASKDFYPEFAALVELVVAQAVDTGDLLVKFNTGAQEAMLITEANLRTGLKCNCQRRQGLLRAYIKRFLAEYQPLHGVVLSWQEAKYDARDYDEVSPAGLVLSW